MRRLLWIPLVLAAACHAHTTAAQNKNEAAQKEAPPAEKQVSSPRPVRTTPNAMLDEKSMHDIQQALSKRGIHVEPSGHLDTQTQKGLREFQAREKMAPTGLPDYDTLRKLGLDPHDIYVGGTERKTEEKKQKNEAKR
jgi:peptidoglycan hydrolase-like protein with peptidoglycan-binding domain